MLADLIARIQREPKRRPQLIKEYAQQVGAPLHRIHRQLKDAGHGSGRKRRSDAGTTRAPEEQLEQLAALQISGVRKTGQATRYTPDTLQILRESGMDLGGLSVAQINRLMRERGIDQKTQSRGRQTHADITSRHPNDLHLVDPSSALVYYLPASARTRARQRNVADIHGVEPYKNKPGLQGKKAQLRVWRYVIVDHATGCLRVRYYQQAGEAPDSLWEFLCEAWRPEHGDRGQWHGLPNWLWWDKGSDNAAIRAALDALGVQHHAHMPGNSRAKGSVEKAQRIVETQFESRLELQPVESVEELNERVERWCDAYNANLIRHLDTRLSRPGIRVARLELWQRITAEQLRELPADALDLAVYQPVERKVAGNLTISYRHPKLKAQMRYRVGNLPGVRVGQKVTVQPLLVDGDEGAIRVRHTYRGEEYEERVVPREYNEFGLPVDGAAPGEFRPLPLTEVEQAGVRLRELAGPKRPGKATFGGKYRALDAAEATDGENIIQMPRRQPRPETPAATLTLREAGLYVRQRLGEDWDPALFDTLVERWPRGASAAELDAWAAELAG